MSRQDKILAFRAALLLAWYVFLLRVRGVKSALRGSRAAWRGGVVAPDGDFPPRAAAAVARAGRLMGIGTCLSRSLAVRRLLRSVGIDACVRIGTRRAGGALEAHAWVEYVGQTLGESPDGLCYNRFPARL